MIYDYIIDKTLGNRNRNIIIYLWFIVSILGIR